MASEVHHAKARDLLSQIDEAKRQKDKNERLRNAFLDAEDLVLQVHSQLFVEAMLTEADGTLRDAELKRLTFEKELSFESTTRRQSAARYIAECGLQAPPSLLVDDDHVAGFRGVDTVTKRLKDIRPVCQDPALLPFFDTALGSFSKAVNLVEDSRIDSDGWLPVVIPLLDAMELVARTRPLAEPLAEVEQEITRLNDEDQLLDEKQRGTAEHGEIALNENVAQERLTLLEGVSDLMAMRFKRLSNLEMGTLHKLIDDVANVRSVATSNASKLRAATASKRETLVADRQRIQTQQTKADRDEDLVRSSYLSQCADSTKALDENKQKQEKCWERMLAIQRELQGLAQERRAEIDRRVRLMEREERRRCDMQQFNAFATEHLAVLQRSLEACEAEQELAMFMEEFVRQACLAIEGRVQTISTQLKESRNAAYHEHAVHFRKQYLLLGDLMYRKERLVDEIDKRIALLNLRQEAAMDKYDPSAKQLALQRAEADQQRAEVLQTLVPMRQKAEAYVQNFKPTEMVLLTTSSAYVHPLAELQALNKQRAKKLDSYLVETLVSHDRQTAADRLRAVASSSRVPPRAIASVHEVEAEMEQIERDRTDHALHKYRPPIRKIETADSTLTLLLRGAAASSSSTVDGSVSGTTKSLLRPVAGKGSGGGYGGADPLTSSSGGPLKGRPLLPPAGPGTSTTTAAAAVAATIPGSSWKTAKGSTGLNLCEDLEPQTRRGGGGGGGRGSVSASTVLAPLKESTPIISLTPSMGTLEKMAPATTDLD